MRRMRAIIPAVDCAWDAPATLPAGMIPGMDVVVIGAGIVGASCAFHLAERGARVRVLERAPTIASGSTGRSAAGIRAQFSHPANVAMSRFSMAAFAAFEDRHGVDAGYRTVGYLFLVPPQAERSWRADGAMQREHGARLAWLDPDDLAERYPWIDPTGLAGASLGLDDGVLDPHAITSGWLASARALGALLHLDTEVTGLERKRGAWRVDTDRETFEADAVVNAAGPQAARVAALAGLDLPVEPSRRTVYVTAPLADVAKPTPLTIDLDTGVYVRSEGERFLFGRSNPAEPPGENLAVDWAWLEPTLELALPRFPFLERAGLDRRACWAGLYAMTPDHLPILGRDPGLDGWFHANGFSGHGVQHAPATGRIVAEELFDGRCTTFDLTDFRVERFARRTAAASERHVV